MNKKLYTYYLILILSVVILLSVFATITSAQELDNDGLPVLHGPISILDAVTNAVKNQPSIQSADSDISVARSRRRAANAMTGLTASATVFAGKSSAGDIITNPPDISPADIFSVQSKSGISSQASFMFPLSTGGKLDADVKSADALYKSAVSDKAVAELDAALNARVAYHRVLEADAILDEVSSLINETTERVRIAEAFYNEGKIAKFDLLRAQSMLADAKQQLANDERDVKNAVVALKSVMGISQTSDISAMAYLVFNPKDATLDTLLADAMKNRPELASIRAKIESASAQIDAAKGAYKPQIYGLAMQGFSAGSGESESGYTIGISAGIPLIDRGLRRSKIDESKANLASMKAEENRLKLLIQQEVYTAYNELQAASKYVKLSEASIEATKENYRIMKLRNAAGKAILADLMESLMYQVKAQNDRIFAIHDHNIAWDKILRAIGEPITKDEQTKENVK